MISTKTKKEDSKNENGVEFRLRDKEMTKLRPISVLDDKAWILIYLSAEMLTRRNGVVTIQYNNYPHFVTSEKEFFNIIKDELNHDFLIPEIIIGENVRWRLPDVKNYLQSNVKVDLKNVFENTMDKVIQNLDLESLDHAKVYILWAIGTYAYRIFEFYPILDFLGPFGAGKSKALSLLECLCYNAILSKKISGPYWSRTVESLNSTLLIDEREDLLNPRDEYAKDLKNMLHHAWKTAAQEPKLVQHKNLGWITKRFDVGTPIALGHMNMLNEVTASRTIPLRMIKSTNKEIIATEVKEGDPIWFALRDGYYRTFLDYHDEIIEINKEPSILDDSLTGREKSQIWKPIITLAKLFEHHGVDGLVESVIRVVKNTHEIREETSQPVDINVQVVEFISEAIQKQWLKPIGIEENKKHWYKQQDILQAIHANYTSLQFMTSKQLGKILHYMSLQRGKKDSRYLCVFITDEILKDLYSKYNIL